MGGGVKVGQLFAELKLDKKGFQDGLKSAGGGFKSLAGMAAKAAVAIAAAMVVAIGASVKFAADFEKSMANVHTLIGSGSESEARIGELSQQVKGMSMETGKSLEDLSGGLYQVISAFGDTADSTEILRIAAKSASAGLADTEDAVNLLSAVTKGYGDTSAGTVQKVADLAFQTVKLGQTTFPELAGAMGKVVPLASTMGVSMEELFGATSTLTGVTGDTNEVMTQLRGTLSAFAKPNANMIAALKELGFKSGDAAIEALGYAGALEAVQGTQVVAEKGAAKVWGRVEALNAVLALTGSQADVFAEKTLAMGDAAGAATEAYDIQADTFEHMFDRVKASFGVVLVTIGERFLPVMKDVLDWVLVNWDTIAEVIDIALSRIGTVIKFVVEEIFPILIAVFKFITEEVLPPIIDMFGNAAPGAVSILGEAFKFISETIVPILTKALDWVTKNVVPPLQAVFKALAAWFKENGPLIGRVMQKAGAAIGAAFNYMSTIIGAVWPGIEAVAKILFPIIGQAATILLKGIEFAFGAIEAIFKAITPIAKAMIDSLVFVFKALLVPVKAVWDGVTSVIKGAINFVIGILNKFIDFVGSIHIDVPSVDIPLVGRVGGFRVGLPQIPHIPMLAEGVQGWGGGLAIVGEKGPELLNLPRGSDVIGAEETSKMLGGDKGGDTYNIYGVQPGDVMREVMRANRRMAVEWGVR